MVPRLDLGVTEAQLVRQLHPVLHAQVLLPLEALLQRLQLVVGEGRARFPLLFTQPGRATQPEAVLYAVAVLVLATWNRVKMIKNSLEPSPDSAGNR